MLSPIILPDEILDEAERIGGIYRERWHINGDCIHVGDVEFVSPIDRKLRIVRFLLDSRFYNKGKTLYGIREPGNEYRFDTGGNTVAINSHLISCRDAFDDDIFMPILIHEICHAIDPIFEQEFQLLNSPHAARAKLSHSESCRLLHEQRAFTGMWIWSLSCDLINGICGGPDMFITRYRSLSTEFDWFCISAPELMDQNREHFRLMIGDLNGR